MATQSMRARAARRRKVLAGLLAVTVVGGVAIVCLNLATASTLDARGTFAYRIRPGDNLTMIAARFHTTVGRLVTLNHLTNPNLIQAGAVLIVPAPAVRTSATAPAGPMVRASVPYRVRPGDTLWAIALRYHTTVEAIQAANRLGGSTLIRPGELLRVPMPPRSLVQVALVDTARHYGLRPALAEAVAWEESGFQERVVSHTGARGVMQVEPYTARYVERDLLHRQVDLNTVRGNVQVGVRFLARLLFVTHQDVRLAVAGYYEGLGNVERHGMYKSTKRYVANVLALERRFAAV